MKEKNEDNLFENMGLSVQYGQVEVGQTYPIYGSITKFVSDIPGDVVLIVNDYIEMKLLVDDEEKINILKSRTFEPGIFVCVVTQVEPSIKCDCTTVVFGKKDETPIQ